MTRQSGNKPPPAWQVITEETDQDPAMTAYLQLLVEEAEEALHIHASIERQEELVDLDAEQVQAGPMKRFIERLRRNSIEKRFEN